MKAILIIKAPQTLTYDELQSVGDSLTPLNMKLKEDYHVILVRGITDDFVFQGLFPKDFDTVAFEELKMELKENLSLIL